jgi:hypothetical protein
LTENSKETAPAGNLPAGAGTISEAVFLAAETRYLTRNQAGFSARFVCTVIEDFHREGGWSSQVPDETTDRLHLSKLPAHEVL